ncbi:MAG: hypothetical protein AAF560_25825 [Acidobacteriota bacterium]
MSLTTNPTVSVYVKYTQATSTVKANIEYFTDPYGNNPWQPTALAYNSQTKYKFYVANHTDNFGFAGFTFWPENSDGFLPDVQVVESFRVPYYNQQANFQQTDFIDQINLNYYPFSFRVRNRDDTSEEYYVGMELTICPHFRGKSSPYYLTSRDPKIPLLPSGT